MGRRVEKKVTDSGTTSKHERFIYDSYKQIEKLDAANGNIQYVLFVWSGEQLLSMSDTNSTYYYFADANKNIGQLIDSSGNIVAKYEYSLSGKLTVSNDTVNNPFRFSLEYFDEETELVYYNFRYYSPDLGRWLNRDPLGESGGFNLYAIAANNIINRWDYLGMCDPSWFDENIYGPLEDVAEAVADAATWTGELGLDAAIWGGSQIYGNPSEWLTPGESTVGQLLNELNNGNISTDQYSGLRSQINDNKYGHSNQMSELQETYGILGIPFLTAGGLAYEVLTGAGIMSGHVQGQGTGSCGW